jgi:uncharacterized membrane protein
MLESHYGKRPSLLPFPVNIFVAGLALLIGGLALQSLAWTLGGALALIGGLAMIVAVVASLMGPD